MHVIRDLLSKSTQCRLCGGPTHHCFDKQLLGSLQVSYHECDHCHSLQTESPNWLDQAYSGNLADIDTGAAQRNWNNLAVVFHLCKLFGLRSVLDFGAGDGLLCRLLRDYQINALCMDKHASPTYAQGFEAAEDFQPDMVVGFEVVEHFDEPACQLEALFGRSSKVVFISTELYERQGTDWRYLMPSSGQHVFFYSKKALREYAVNHGYEAFFFGRYSLFLHAGYKRGISAFFIRRAVLQLLLNRYGMQLFKLRMGLLRSRGVEADFQLLVARQTDQQGKPRT
jgi:hypothetical protein